MLSPKEPDPEIPHLCR